MQHFKTLGIGGMLILAGVGVAFGLLPLRQAVPPAPVTETAPAGMFAAQTAPEAQTRVGADDWSQPAATLADAELLQLARRQVARSPVQAMLWAQAQAEAGLRQRMILAVLRAWGEVDPRSAVNWALAQANDVRETDLRAVLTGAIRQPKITMDLLRQWLARDPDAGGFYAELFTRALGAAGDFQAAVQFLNTAPTGTVAESFKAVFSLWMQSQPQAALQAVDSISDPSMRALAFHTVVGDWSPANPGGLAAYAAALPPGADRSYALNAAVSTWSLQDPAGLATWLNTLPPGPEFDAGVAQMIARTDGANRSPELAMGWVENIGDPSLRMDSLERVLGEWSQTDPAAAQRYVAGAAWLDDQQRQSILAQFAPAP